MNILFPVSFAVIAYIEGVLPFFMLLAAVLLHEAGHIAAVAASGGGIRRIDIEPLGARIVPYGLMSHRADAYSALAGAAFNVIAFAVSSAVFSVWGGLYALFFALVNLMLAVVNLFPIRGLDGYTALYSLVADRYGADCADKVCKKASAVGTALFFLLSAAAVWLSGFNPGVAAMTSAVNLSKKD